MRPAIAVRSADCSGTASWTTARSAVNGASIPVVHSSSFASKSQKTVCNLAGAGRVPMLGFTYIVSTSPPFDKPIIRNKHCQKCGHPLVRFLLTTGYVIYLHCELCGHEWNEPERRKVPRFQN